MKKVKEFFKGEGLSRGAFWIIGGFCLSIVGIIFVLSLCSTQKRITNTLNQLSDSTGISLSECKFESDLYLGCFRGKLIKGKNQIPYIVVKDLYDIPIDTINFHLSEPLKKVGNKYYYNFKSYMYYGSKYRVVLKSDEI